MRLSLASLVSLLILFMGCSSMSQEGGIFEDKSQAYLKARSLDNPIAEDALYIKDSVYTKDPLYPIPSEQSIQSGQYLSEIPRVTSALMSLEQGAIVLHKSGDYDRVLFASLYKDVLSSSIEPYLKRRHILIDKTEGSVAEGHVVMNDSVEADSVGDLVHKSQQLNGAIMQVVVTEWTGAKRLGYNTPSFMKRLFGAKSVEHQYAYIVSKPNQQQEQHGFENFVIQLHVAHRTRHKGQNTTSPWGFSTAQDDYLGLEMVNFVEDLKREVALSSSSDIKNMDVSVQEDGNGLPYLSLAERFPIVWETLLKIVPRQNWTIADVDRSKGVMYLKVIQDTKLSQLMLNQFQLHLVEGPQVMILSVELSDEQPAGIEASRHILKTLERKLEIIE